MITVENLTREFKTYKKYEGFKGAIKSLFSNEYTIKKAVDSVNFTINQGEIVGYIGVNGAGKSTTIKMMTGILVPTSGKCQVNGIVPYEHRQDNAKNIGVVFGQRTQLWWDLPLSESFGILQKIYEIPQEKFKENLAYLKELLGLDEFFTTPVRNLSLGQKMRADFAASMLHEPKVLFLDEPTIGLDIVVKEKIRKAIKDINKKNKTTIILTTHDLDDIEEVCNRIIVIDGGKKIFDGGIKDLKKNFAKYRSIKFDIRHNQYENINKLLGVEEADLLVKEEENELELKFHKDKLKIADIISKIVNIYEVRDITIEEPQMEDVVKEIYSGKIRN